MTNPTSKPSTNRLEGGMVTYEDVRVIITPEAPRHYRVAVSEPAGEQVDHAVEDVVINGTAVVLDDSIWFDDVQLDVGVPVGEPGDTVWVWV